MLFTRQDDVSSWPSGNKGGGRNTDVSSEIPAEISSVASCLGELSEVTCVWRRERSRGVVYLAR